jgi:hypothetical protein
MFTTLKRACVMSAWVILSLFALPQAHAQGTPSAGIGTFSATHNDDGYGNISDSFSLTFTLYCFMSNTQSATVHIYCVIDDIDAGVDVYGQRVSVQGPSQLGYSSSYTVFSAVYGSTMPNWSDAWTYSPSISNNLAPANLFADWWNDHMYSSAGNWVRCRYHYHLDISDLAWFGFQAQTADSAIITMYNAAPH